MRVFAEHQLVSHAHLREVLDLDQRESKNILGLLRNVARGLYGLTQTPWTPGAAATSIKRCGQHEVTGTLQLSQRLHAASGLGALSGIKEAKVLTHRLGNRRSSAMFLLRQQPSDNFDGGRLLQRSFDLVLCMHAQR